ncbi:CRISPR-associated endoribonuclease Cas6 [Priestia filamentosa]|uniref:CRISPR-associated endoribonuclease Cas6 n=1 Tax=Priestia filamentosa TaxID=1402861 RepID=UPI0005890686
MEIYELSVTCQLFKTHHFSENNELIGKFINFSLAKNKELKEFHKANIYKHYVYQSLYPTEEDGFYKKGRVYIFRLRTLHEPLALKLSKQLKQKNDVFNVLSIERKKILGKRKHISELVTITPLILTIEEEPWSIKEGLFNLQKHLQNNAELKYHYFTNENRKFAPFIKQIELLNRKRIGVKYKGITLLGNKVRIQVNEDEESQLLARTVIGAGLGQKNSALGAGYVTYK